MLLCNNVQGYTLYGAVIMKIVVSKKVPFNIENALNDYTVDYNDSETSLSYDELKTRCVDADALVCMLSDRIDKDFIDACGNLKVIANYAVGYNNIDFEYASEKGVCVCNTPDVLTESTAEIGFGLLMAAGRRIGEAERFTREGKFHGWGAGMMLGHDLYGKTLGVFGMGRIGAAVARMALGFNMNIVYHNRSRNLVAENLTGAKYVEFEEFLTDSDFIVVTAPLTDQTKHRFTKKEFHEMKSTAVFVNIGRGPIVKEADLADALENKEIFAAGLDVYEDEPIINEKLFNLENVVLLPHIGSADVDTRAAMGQMCADSVVQVLKHGEKPATCVF